MMLLRLLLSLTLLLAFSGCAGGGSTSGTEQPAAPAVNAFKATLESRIPRGGVAGCWGYTAPNGDRYGLMGTAKGILVVDLRNPTAARVVDEVDGPTNTPYPGIYWREMRTFGHYAYIVSEQTNFRGGLMILDLAGLPDSVRYVQSMVPRDGRLNAHTVDIDPDRGLLFMQRYSSLPSGIATPHRDPEDGLGGGPTDGSVDVYDLATPENPGYLTTFNQNIYVHDMTARGGFCYVAEGTHNSYSIWDVREARHPALVVRWSVEAGHFAHNIWPSPDGSHVVTTEELPEGLPARIWRLNGAAAPTPISQFQQGTGTPHNAIWMGAKIFFSHYTEGIAVADVADPAKPVLAARYDTSPNLSGPDLNGCWGVFPFPDGRTVIGSDINEGFHLIHLELP
ncbi:MAG: choice-of-anchor B family protein [Acidobacteriota bacterium]|nr:choice-of-anchor B family protein [Acidobacteriota bacterium]